MGTPQGAALLLEAMETAPDSRRHLLALGIPRDEVHMATRSRKGYWRMSANSIVQRALTQPLAAGTRRSRHAHVMDYSSLRADGPRLSGTARCGPACRVVWHP